MDRLLARMGVIQEAERLSGSHPQVEWARAMMAMVRLGGSLSRKPCRDLYGHLGAAFYGLATVMSTPIYAGLISDPPGRTADLGADSLQ